jgi:hypothetical protein
LFLIDHVGRPPSGLTFRQHTDQVVAEHLKRHSYYYQKSNLPGLENRRRVNLHRMRRSMERLLAKAKSTFYQPRRKGDDSADTLFRKGTTEGLPHGVLAKHEYDKFNFSESDLPGYEASASEGDEDVVVEVEAQVNQKGKQVANEEHVGSTRHHVLVEKLSKEDAAQISSPSRNSDTSFVPTRNDSDELSSEDENVRYFVANDNLEISNTDDSRTQVEAEAAATLSTKFNPACVKKVKSEAEDSEDELGQDRVEVGIAAISPMKADAALIRGVKRGAKEIEDINAGTEPPPKKRGCPTKYPVDASTQPAHRSPPQGADYLRVSQPTPYMTSTLAMQEGPMPRIATPFKPATPTFVSQRPRLPNDGKEGIQSQVRTWVETAKRKRGDVNFDDMINSSADDTAVRPAERKDSKLALKLDPKPGHLNTAQTSAVPLSKPAVDTSAPIVVDATPEKE